MFSPGRFGRLAAIDARAAGLGFGEPELREAGPWIVHELAERSRRSLGQRPAWSVASQTDVLAVGWCQLLDRNWIVDALLLAVAVLASGALVHIQAFASAAAHHLHAEARSHGVVMDDQPEVAGLDGRRQVHHGDAGSFRDAELDRSAFGALVFTEEVVGVVGVVGVLQPDGRRKPLRWIRVGQDECGSLAKRSAP